MNEGQRETVMQYVEIVKKEARLPFGGVKDTGNGHREASHAVLDAFSEWKPASIDFSGTLQEARIDNAE